MCRHLQIETEISGKLISPERRCQGYAGFGWRWRDHARLTAFLSVTTSSHTKESSFINDEAASTRCYEIENRDRSVEVCERAGRASPLPRSSLIGRAHRRSQVRDYDFDPAVQLAPFRSIVSGNRQG